MAVVHGRRHLVRRARPADDPVLHLLLDVRLPAHRRPGLGLRRRTRPRVPDGRHGRPDHAAPARGCSTTTATRHMLASTVPNIRAYDPAFAYELAVIVRDGIGRMYGEGRGRLLLRHPLQRELRAAGEARWRRRGHPARPVPVPTGRTRARAGRSSLGVGLDPAPGHQGAAAAGRAATTRRRRLERAVASSCCATRRSRSSAGTGCIPEAEPRVPYVVQQLARTEGPIVAATDYLKALPHMVAPWMRSAVHRARHRWLRSQRHARGAAHPFRGQPGADRLRRAARPVHDRRGQPRGAGAGHRRAGDRPGANGPAARLTAAGGLRFRTASPCGRPRCRTTRSSGRSAGSTPGSSDNGPAPTPPARNVPRQSRRWRPVARAGEQSHPRPVRLELRDPACPAMEQPHP